MPVFLFLIVVNGPCQEKFIIPRKKGRWVREHSQKGRLKKRRWEELRSGQYYKDFLRQGKSPWRHVIRLKIVTYHYRRLHTQPPAGTLSGPEGQGYPPQISVAPNSIMKANVDVGVRASATIREIWQSGTSVISLGRKISSLFVYLLSSYYINSGFGLAETFCAASNVKTLEHNWSGIAYTVVFILN